MSNNEGINQDQMVESSTDSRLETRRILETLADLEGCSGFYSMLRKANADSLLNRPGLHTLFVPRDGGAHGLGGEVDEIEVISLLSSCLVNGAVKTEDLRTQSEIETASGAKVSVSDEDGALRFGSANIVRPDIICTDGVIHVLDSAPAARPAAKAAERRR